MDKNDFPSWCNEEAVEEIVNVIKELENEKKQEVEDVE